MTKSAKGSFNESVASAYDYTKDIRSYLKSSLFNSYYLEKGFVSKFKDSWISDTPAWEHFYQGIFEFIESKDESFFLTNKPSESETIKSYIAPIMALLGWDKFGFYNHYDTETTYDYDGKPYRPDLVYFDNPKDQQKVQALKGKIKSVTGKRKKEFQDQLRVHVEKSHSIIVEAKMFGLLKPNSKRKDELKEDSMRDKTPEGQIVTYMEMLRSNRAILTDGGVWKLFHNDFRSEDKCVTFDFGKLALWLKKKINQEGFERGSQNFKKDEQEFDFLIAFFYNLFSREAVLGEKVNHLVENTKKYSEHLEDKIKNRFVMAVTHACNGLASAVRERGKNPEEYLDLIKKTAESHLFNIIFFRSLESRGILPYYGEDNSYDKLSISKTIDSIYENGFSPTQSFKSQLNMFEDYYHERVDSKTSIICNNLIKLYKAVHKGISNGIHIEGFKESLFSSEEWEFANEYKVPDEYMMNVIFYLNLVPKDRELGEYQLIPYDFLTPRELGSIFESFLEFKITKAKQPMFWDYKRKQWLANDSVKQIRKNEIIKKGEYFFTPDNEERKMTGAYYTPSYIVDFIVSKMLSELCVDKKPKEILELKICDPAMGSGHFLKGVLDFLTEAYIASHFRFNIRLEESRVEIKNKILSSCVYGADINQSAVKLAKMSMWLCTADSNQKLECLDKKLITADSLELREDSDLFKTQFNSILGNPPYGASFDRDTRDLLFDKFTTLNGKSDSFHVFLEKLGRVINQQEGGSIGVIVPNSVLTLDSFSNLRSFLSSIFSDIEVHDFGYRVFEDATVDTCVLLLRKKSKGLAYLSYKDYLMFDSQKCADLSYQSIDSVWRSPSSGSKLSKLKMTVGDFFDVCQGTKAYEVGRGTPVQTKKMLEDKVYSTKKKLGKDYRPFLYGSDIGPFKLIWKKKEYIKFGVNLAAPRDDKFHSQERVVLQRIRNPKLEKRLVATFLSDDSIASAGLSIIVPKKKFKVSMKALAVYLNLPTVNNWFGSINNDVNIKPTKIKTIPIDLRFVEKGGALDLGYQKCVMLAEKGKIGELEDFLMNLDEQTLGSDNKKIRKAS